MRDPRLFNITMKLCLRLFTDDRGGFLGMSRFALAAERCSMPASKFFFFFFFFGSFGSGLPAAIFWRRPRDRGAVSSSLARF